MFLEAVTVSGLITSVGDISTGLLTTATNMFNWAITNPVYLLGIGISLFGIGFGIVRKITRR